jgi:hypothetical protein
MKKSILFVACCIGLMLFASCKKDPIAPTISVITDTGYVTENAQLFSGDNIMVGFNATGEKLTKIEITLTENGTVINSSQATIENLTSYSHTAAFTVEATGTITITGTITDAAGQTASKNFNIICDEKPNAKFIGHYEGDALFTGIMKAEMDGMDPIENEVTDRAFPVTLDLREGETMTDVIGTCKIEDQEMEITGTVEGNTVTFEAVNTTVSYNYEFNGFNIPLNMNITYAVTGVLDNETLALDGSCNGEGELHILIYNGTSTLEGTIGGSLTKQ